MPVIDVPNLGRYRVPDTLSEDELRSVIRGLYTVAGVQAPGPSGLGGVFKSALSRGAQQMLVGAGYDLPALGLAGLAKLGFGGAEDKAREFLEKGAQKYAQIEEALPTQYRDVTKLQGPGEYLGFAVEKAGEGLPSIASALLPGGVAAATGRTAARKIAQEAAETALRGGASREIAERIGQQAAQDAMQGRVGMALMSTSYAQTAPESFRNVFEETNRLEPGVALATGLVNSFIESYVPGKILGDLGAYGRVKLVEKAAEKAGLGTVAARIGARATGIAAQEGLTEATQDVINNAAIKVIDENYQVFSPENLNKYINSFASGAAAGFGPGLIGASGRQTRPELIPPRGGITEAPPEAPVAPVQPIPPVAPPEQQAVPPITQQAVTQQALPLVTQQAAPQVTEAAPQVSLPVTTQPTVPQVTSAPEVTPVLSGRPPVPPVTQATPQVTQTVPQITQALQITSAPPVTQALPAPTEAVPPVTSVPVDRIPPSLQPRDRSSQASVQQMQGIAKDPDPRRLGQSNTLTDGAPMVIAPSKDWSSQFTMTGQEGLVVAPDGTQIPFRYAVIPASAADPSHNVDGSINRNFGKSPFIPINNGRIAGIKGSYAAGNPKYKDGILPIAKQLGVPDSAYPDPMLVRVVDPDQVPPNIGDLSNQPSVLGLTEAEEARQDAGRIDIQGLEFNEDGSPTYQTLAAFINAMPANERQRLAPNNQPTAAARKRLRNAVFAATYEDQDLLDLVATAEKEEQLNIINAMLRAAPALVQLKGMGEYDIRPNVVEAAKGAINASREGKSIEKYASERDFMRSDLGDRILDFFGKHARKSRYMADELTRVAKELKQETEKTETDMFGEVPRKPVMEIVETLGQDQQPDIFEQPTVPPVTPALTAQATPKPTTPPVTPAPTQAVPQVPKVTPAPTKKPVIFTGATQEERDMFDVLRAELDALGLKDLNLELIRPKKTKDGYELGQMSTKTMRDPADLTKIIALSRVMRIAIDLAQTTGSIRAKSKEQIKTILHHEVIHAMRSMNLFTADEWRILSEASERDWVKRKWPMDHGYTVEDIYSKASKDTKLEEGVARAFEYYTRGEFQPAGAVARIFQKTKEFFQKLADYAMGLGITENEAEIFERILSGEIGSRLRKDQALYKVPYDKANIEKASQEDLNTISETENIIFDSAMLNIEPEQSMNNLVKSGPDFKELRDSARNYVKDLATDKADILLSAFNLRQLGDLAEKVLPQVKTFYRTVNDMLAFRDTRVTKAADIAQGWVAFRDKNPDLAAILSDVMHDATIIGIDPDTNLALIKQGAAQGKLFNDTKSIYKNLENNWAAISANPEALKIYKDVRNYYSESLKLYEDALAQRIKESIEDDRQKTAALLKLEQEFNNIRNTGPYFPLARFGDYWVSFKVFNDEGKQVPEYYMFESRADQRKFEDELRKSNVSFKSGVKTREMLGAGVPMTGFMREMMGLVDGMGGDKDALKDNIWQLFLTMQPDLSARKHFIHRKKIAGYSTDALRAFAETSFHGAYHLARVKYNGRLESIVLDANRHKTANPSIEADRYFDELLRRQKWVNAPEDVNSFTSWATSFSFLYFLTAPASALVNIAQTPMVAFPYLGGKFGFGRAFSELSTASKQFFASGIGKDRGFYDVIRTLRERAEEKGISDKERITREEELAAMQQLYEDGTLNRTQTLSLAGLAERPSDILQGGIGSVMKSKAFNTVEKVTYALGYAFNQAEVFNRQITALAAYRLAKQKGMAPDLALQTAKDIVNETHFEYTNATKPRFMQGPTARIIFQFKNYAQQMTVLLVKTLRHAVSDADPEVEKEARKRLTGILFMTGLFAGYEGLPLFWVIEGVMNAMFDDEDEPYDFLNSAKNNIADMFGSNAARILSKGAVSEVLGGDIANRVSMNGMWIRDSNKSADEVESFKQFVIDLTGPFVGIGVNMADGIKKINDGNTYRGIEAMLPPVLKDFMKVGRMATEGATTLRGDPIVGEVSTWGLFLQALGFTPVDVARGYEAMGEIKGMERDVERRRKRLLQQASLAQINGDYTEFAEIYEKIEKYNSKNPQNPITQESIKRSLSQRVKDSDRALRGIIVNPKREYLLEEARYLGEEE